MRSNNIIPDEVCDKFGVERGKTLGDLFAQVGSIHNINKKGTSYSI